MTKESILVSEESTRLSFIYPLDLHSGNTARRLGLLTRKTNDWKAVEELTSILRNLILRTLSNYDFALFSIGVNEKF